MSPSNTPVITAAERFLFLLAGFGLSGAVFSWIRRRARSASPDNSALRHQVEAMRSALAEKTQIIHREREAAAGYLAERDRANAHLAAAEAVRAAQSARLDDALRRLATLDAERAALEQKLEQQTARLWRSEEHRTALAFKLEQTMRQLEQAAARPDPRPTPADPPV